MASEQAEFGLDRGGVAMIAAVGLVLGPGLLLATMWKLSHGLIVAETSVTEWVFITIALGLLAVIVRLTVRELRWGVNATIDERGVRAGGVALAWDEIERLEAPRFGVLVVAGGGRQVPLRTYLFHNRRALLEHIARHTGKPVPEMAYSY